MTELMNGRDVLVVLPTGAGKSAIYQVPTVLRPGLTVIVSPLLALQQDQVESIAESRAPLAVAVNSAQRTSERQRAWSELRSGSARYLFLSPEQLRKSEVLEELSSVGVGLFVVDEAHCVSAWGHDFRPDYLRLAPVIERLGHPPVLALTATAALPVRNDIKARLGLRNPTDVIASFDRPNLRLAVLPAPADQVKRAAVLDKACTLAAEPRTSRGLVYTATRKDAEFYAQALLEKGVRSAAYHAGLRAADRTRAHERFLNDELDVVVATSAFGMGIDKPDVRFVLHASAPESLDSYYQQIGRAGRDGETSEISLHYRPDDLHLQTFLTASNAPQDVLINVVEAVGAAAGGLTPSALRRMVGASRAKLTRALNLLEQAGAIRTEALDLLRLTEPLRRDEAVERAVDLATQHQALIRSRIEMMRGYAETTGCRRQFLLGYFGEQLSEPCGNCDTCNAGTTHRLGGCADGFAVNCVVRHSEWGHGMVMSTEQDRLTVLFDAVGYKTLSLSSVRAHELLSVE
jgi:ATP-dependent DNA helicase RecQ